MKTTAVKIIVEKGSDGLFSAYCPDFRYKEIYSFGGYGDTAAEAKADFLASVEEIKAVYKADTGNDADDLDNIKFEWHYDIPSMFGCFPYINISRFADAAHINASKMRQYARGIAFPSEKTTRKIADAVNVIAQDLANIHL